VLSVHTQAVFEASAQERSAVADLLEGLNGDQLAQSSLCSGWDVRTVAAHLATAVSPSKKPFVVAMLRHRGDMHRANDEIARRAATQPVAQLVATLRRYAGSRFAPPLVGPRGPLTDVLVHAGDMRIPLGLPHQPDNAHVQMALEFVTAGRPIGFVPRGRLDGLRLIPDDLDWSFGNGAVVHGRGINILMSACGSRPMARAPLRRPLIRAAPVQRRLPEGCQAGRISGVDAQALDAKVHAGDLVRFRAPSPVLFPRPATSPTATVTPTESSGQAPAVKMSRETSPAAAA